MSSARPSLPKPISIAKFWKSRNHSHHVRVEISEYQEHCLINVRVWQTGSDGIDRPTTKGIALDIRKLPTLAASINKALAKARELHLIDGDSQASDGEGE